MDANANVDYVTMTGKRRVDVTLQWLIFFGYEQVGIGMCIRDDACDFVLTKASWFSPICDVDIGEAVVFLTALEWTSDLQFDNVDFTLDSKKVVDALRTCVEDGSEFRCILDARRQLFQSRFQIFHVEFNRRQANDITRKLVQAAPRNASSHNYFFGKRISNPPKIVWWRIEPETLSNTKL